MVLKDHENCYSFFIHSPVKDRIKRLVETEGVSERQAKKMIKQTDWERSSYHNYYTKQKWGDPEVMIYMIIEIVAGSCYVILTKEPVPIDELKPYLYQSIRLIIKNHIIS